MKGLVKYAPGSQCVELRDLPEPSPREGELKVRVLAVSICGSDLHAVDDRRTITMPLTLGHEYVGQVVETCGDVGDFRPGDWVISIPACYNCGVCPLCKKGLVTLCKQHRSIGVMAPGAMAEYVVVSAAFSYHVPATTSIEDKIPYALTEPLACTVRGIYERIAVKSEDTAVVSGPGVMGLMALQVLKSRGAHVILSGLPQDQERLALGKQLGADETVSSLPELRTAVYRRNSLGADITCDTTGVPASLKTCLEVTRPLGVHLQIGMFGAPVTLSLDSLMEQEITYVPSYSTATSTWPITLKLLAEGKVSLAPLVSRTYPLTQWQTAFEAVRHKEVYKAVLLPNPLWAFTN